MERRNARRSREIVVPGDVLGDSDAFDAGDNAYEAGGKICSLVAGVKSCQGGAVGVIPMSGCYMPETGDTVIGVISDIGPSNWMADIGAPYPAPLHVSEVPWKVEFGDTSRFLTVGDVVLMKVLLVDESKKIKVTMKDSGLRKIEGGELVTVPHSRISRVIGKGGSMIQMLKEMTDCRILVGQNGRIWIDGDDENVAVAADAVRLIDEQARAPNLTERVRDFIAGKIPQSALSDGGDYDGEGSE